MGALHQGHLDIVQRAHRENGLTVTSVFVNPRQFNDSTDFDTYPRKLEHDEQKLASAGCDMLLAPEVEAIYPSHDPYPRPAFDLGLLGEVLEGPRRPGHFEGMLDVVHRLFCIVQPNRAYFGQKDLQQLLIVKAFAQQHHPDVEIVAHPTQRAADGLALSSRNARLSPAGRKEASSLYQSMVAIARQAPNAASPENVVQTQKDQLKTRPRVQEVEYLSVREARDLAPCDWHLNTEKVICAAVWIEGVRLIDNLFIPQEKT